MSDAVNVSGVKLTDEQVQWLNAAITPAAHFEAEGIGTGWRILRAVWGALPVTTGTDAP